MKANARFLVKEPVAYVMRYWLHSSKSQEALEAFVKAVDWKSVRVHDGERCYVLGVTPELLMLLAEVHSKFGVPPVLECFRNVGVTPDSVSTQLEIWAWALDVMMEEEG